MNSILRIAVLFTFVAGLSSTYMSNALWACGGGHGSHAGPETKGEKAEVVKDPVCGMEVSNIKKAPTEKYKDEVYYFCSKKCEKAFKKSPAPYICGCAAMMKGCDCGHCKGKEETCPCPLEQEEGEAHEHTGDEIHETKHKHD